jgi:uncharacterized protein Yka (UPF0111/DUF47 family)
MAEAIAAFGLAASIVSFIDFGSKILSAGYKLYKKRPGTRDNGEAQDLAQITESLQRVAVGITKSLEQVDSSHEVPQNELDLRDLAKRCGEVAEELLRAVNGLEVGSKSSKWYSFRTALKSVMAEGRIEALRQRLDQFRQEIVVHILTCFR